MQWVLLLVSGLITITSMAAQTSIGIIAIASQCEFHTTQADKGLMLGACVTGEQKAFLLVNSYSFSKQCKVLDFLKTFVLSNINVQH